MSLDQGAPTEPADDQPPPTVEETDSEEVDLLVRVAELEETVKALAWGITSESEALREEIESLRPAQGANDAPTKQAPRPWVATARPGDWQKLAEWVDWLNTAYDLIVPRTVLPCWPAHGGAVHELAALRSAWLHAAASPEPGEAMTYWHDRYLFSCLARLREDYQMRACTDEHVSPRARRITDLQTLAAVLVDVASGTSTTDADGVDSVTGELG